MSALPSATELEYAVPKDLPSSVTDVVWHVVQGQELRGAVVGGSIAGCAAAIACGRAGLPVEVYERSGDALADRGFGITLPEALLVQLVEAGYLDAEMPVHDVSARAWLVRDKARPYEERELIRTDGLVAACNWALVWRSLRSRVPDSVYHAGERAELAGEELHLSFNGASGTTRPFGLVIGADGMHSAVRPLVSPDSVRQYAGYTVWRARVVVDKLSGPLEILHDAGTTVMFPTGHAIYYVIPDVDSDRLVVNWLVYTRMPETDGYDAQRTYPPGTAPELVSFVKELTREEFPPAWAEVVEQTPDEDIAVYPVYDIEVERYARGPLLLVGDAGAITRPHTASGAVKALSDALCLERVLTSESSLARATERYSRERTDECNRLTALGRRLGGTHVDRVPDFSRMGDADVRTWLEAPLKGESNYVFGGGNGGNSGNGGNDAHGAARRAAR